MAEIDASARVFDPSEVARAGAFVSIEYGGTLKLERGFVRATDELPQPQADENCNVVEMNPRGEPSPSGTVAAAGHTDDAVLRDPLEVEDDEPDDGGRLPERLVTELTAYRTLALRAALSSDPDAALLVLLHALALRTFYPAAAETCLEIDARSTGLGSFAPALNDVAAARTLARQTRLRAEVIAERELAMGATGEARTKLAAAVKRKEDQMTRIVNAIADSGHNPALLAKLASLEAEAGAMRTELEVLDAAEPPAPAEIAEDINAQIHAAAQQIENLISHPTHPDAPKLREKVRSMIDRITIGRQESGAIEVEVRGTFAGVMQAAGLAERHAPKMKKAPDADASGASLSVVAGAGFEPAAFRL